MTVTQDGPTPFDANAFDYSLIPDHDNDFVNEEHFEEFAKALSGGDGASNADDQSSNQDLFITALNDWRPVHQRVRKHSTDARRKKKRKPPLRGKDETREGFAYTLLKWPLFFIVMAWLIVLGVAYLFTRFYIFLYEHFVAMRGTRHRLRQDMRRATTYEQWIENAKAMDTYLNNNDWKGNDEYAYYNSRTVRSVRDQLHRLRSMLEDGYGKGTTKGVSRTQLVEDLRTLLEGCVKDNFVGMENPHLYSETYYGTKDLVQSLVDEIENCMKTLTKSKVLSNPDKSTMYQHFYTNYGRSALCLSGGATFAYYHFGLAKALLEADVLPKVITGTSGGALVAALLATRTDEELKRLIVPALAHRINACSEPLTTWLPRWWKTGARFDSIDWAKRCAWFCHGSLTFREAYERTGRILNVTCIPSEPSSPNLLANYLTAPDCVIWSAVLASAAVPGILNPVVLMRKTRTGKLAPYSFGNKWKDGSLRTDIPLKALNTHFNVNFSIVSQVNPHINLFFFSSRGAVGRPVTHRRGRGWRGGFLGSAVEQYLKLDLTKWLKVLRHLELLPRYFGQDWSELWLQRFSGTITIWPRVSFPSDFMNILSDPDPQRLARMIHVGQQSAFPKLKFIRNRMKIERQIEEGWSRANPNRTTRELGGRSEGSDLISSLSEDDMQVLLQDPRKRNGQLVPPLEPTRRGSTLKVDPQYQSRGEGDHDDERKGSGLSNRITRWLSRSPARSQTDQDDRHARSPTSPHRRRGSFMSEIGRQSRVFIDDGYDETGVSEEDGSNLQDSAGEWDDVSYTQSAPAAM